MRSYNDLYPGLTFLDTLDVPEAELLAANNTAKDVGGFQDDTGKILAISALMFVSTFLVGMTPLFCKCNPVLKDYISVYGGGLLIGAALAIILPEGIIVLLVSFLSECSTKSDTSESHAGHSHAHGHEHPEAVLTETSALDTHEFGESIGMALACGFAFMLIADQLMVCYKESKASKDYSHSHIHEHEGSEVGSPMRSHSEHSHGNNSPNQRKDKHNHHGAGHRAINDHDDEFRNIRKTDEGGVSTEEQLPVMAKKVSAVSSKSCAANPSSTWHLHHHHHDHDHMNKEHSQLNKALKRADSNNMNED